ncbi:hypothetical protein [Pseudoflavonifractor sp. An85]|uniref:hypothetical protein n=1 Tax=Pseudoflavonifractor sp. An85 TaxID=1965661 RepID=UPI000B383B72|nr:hypothetical protein [Pseudoflavonifractor sp. An85]OUN20705.1 hypothetical protein B5G37_12070 [Pseudoflavonifractor sp. An85]
MTEQPNHSDYTPASFEKRVAAWVGIVYMLMLTAVVTYTLATARSLPGTAPLLLVPLGVGVPFIVVHRQRQGTAPGGLVGSILMLVACVASVVLGLWLGLPALLANLAAL